MASCTNTSSSESTFFVEKEEVLGLISTLSSHDSTSSSYSAGAPAIESSSNLSSTQQESNLSEDAALSKVRAILDKYLECPTLLDPYLEVMVRKLSLPAREIIHELFLRQCQRRDFETNLNCSDAAYERDNKFFDGTSPKQGEGDKFQANHLSPIELIESNKKLDTLIHLLSAIYSLSKVRGRKYISRLLPHDVADVEPVLAALRWFGWLDERARNMDFIQDVSSLNDTSGGTDGGFESNSAIIVPEEMQHFYLHLQQQKRRKRNSDLEAKPWESVHSLLTWLSIISLVPFDLSTIDSTLVCHRFCDAAGHNIRSDDTRGKHSSMTLVQSILTTSASHLTDTGPTRETAAACMASLLSRPDLDKFELERFMYWCCGILIWFRTGERAGGGNLERIGFENCSKSSSNQTFLPMPDQTPNIFLVMGTIQTLAAIFKTGHRSNMLSSQQTFRGIELLWEQAIIIAEGSESGSRSMGGTIVLRKLLVKLFARLGCAYLPPRVAAWRYQRGKRSLVENLMKGSAATNTTTANNKNKDTFCDHGADSSVESGLFPVPDQVEDAMDQLLRSLTDPSTIVRWSAAKGIGRLTERLPAICADDVLDALLQTCSDPERDRAWHGTCLALAELARRGLLLPQRLGQVVPIVIQAIRYDVRRGQHSVGAHVRDAACYTCWAFARAYAPSVLKPHVRDLSVALVLASLFDREVNCRRAASAAFQESVGRQGADNFKHGIAILTTADYYSLGNRTDAFMKSALDIAEFEEYQTQIIDHLSESKLIHWDIEIRVLASKSLSRISKLNPSYCEMRILPALLERCFSDDLVVRHGSLLGCAEMVLAFGELDLFRSDDFVRDGVKLSIADLVPSIEKARLYRGRGGEIMRGAACRMIECIALASISLTVKQQVRLLDSIDACLVHPNESIQNSAAKALNALLTHYFPVSSNGPSARLQNRVVDKYISAIKTDDNPAATRGFSLALGALPAKLLAPSGEVLNSVLTCLSEASRKEALVGGESDAETRRNSIISLVNICKTVGIGTAHASKGDSFPIYPLTTTQTKFVFGTLLAAMDDYNTDRRGDVGSWSRIAAMNGLETLAYLAVGATSALSHRDEDAYTLTQKTDLENIDPIDVPLLPDCRSSAKEKPNDVRLYFDEKTCHAMFSALLKQLGEKLDAVRSEAGGCLERLLTCDSPRVPFVPNRDMLIKSLAVEKPKNWSNPAHTFPLLMSAINVDEYLEPILSGVVISVGGLTESVSKSSSAALFEWIKSLRIAGETRKLNEMGRGCFFTVFIRMFQQYKRNGRVLLPLLSTLDKLLFHGSLDELLCNEQNMFLTDLLMRLSSESKGCTDVKRLLAIVGVTVNLLQPHLNNVMKMRHDIIRLLLVLLLNRYPRVRRYTAEQLYVKLLEDGTALFNDNQQVDRASHLLLNVVWHEEHDPFGQILESRNMIADLLDVPLSTEERNAKIGIRQAAIIPEEDFANYSALVSSTS